ncbi:proliferating cell nuclear antigen-like [Triticum aestivum]|uniref:proliferating cell nuclear antigen-like n=1 Tax=Triticum aestivum TaxID=4565 RepID=UPI001D0163FD|nr:proliferating cell nuclear antigen-like [Triticum aestivum]
MAKGSILQGVLEAILDLVNVANVDCSSKGFSLQALDIEHVVFLSLFFPSEVFRSYRCDEDCSMRIAIADMVDLLRASNDGDIITIKVTDQNFEDITITFESPDKTKTTDMDLQLVDARSHRLKISEWHDMESEYQAIFCMPSAQFMLNCKSLSVIDDDVVIRVNEEVISFSTKGKSGCVNISHVPNKTDKPEKASVTLTHVRGIVSLTLNLRYMKSCAKVSTLCDQVNIGLSPLCDQYKIAEKGYIRYFVAPKITEEEEGKTETEEAEGEEGRQRKKAKKMVKYKIAEKGYIRYFMAPKITEVEEGKTETEEAEGEEGRQRKKAKKR